MFFVFYIIEGCDYLPESQAFEYIDDNFPWYDGYKPKCDEIA